MGGYLFCFAETPGPAAVDRKLTEAPGVLLISSPYGFPGHGFTAKLATRTSKMRTSSRSASAKTVS